MAMDAVIVEAAFDFGPPDSLLGQAGKWNSNTLAVVAAKGHGRSRLIEGAGVVGRRVVLLEDTVSTGESVLAAAAALRAEGAELVRCVCIFTWGWQATAAAFAYAGLPLAPLTTLPELLDVATEDQALDTVQRALVEAWVRDPQRWGTDR